MNFLEEYILSKKTKNINKRPKYSMKKLSIGFVSWLLDFSILFSPTLKDNSLLSSSIALANNATRLDKAKTSGKTGNINKVNLFLKLVNKKLLPKEVVEPILENSQYNYYVIRLHRATNANSYWEVSYRTRVLDENASISYIAGSAILSAGIRDFVIKKRKKKED